MSDGEKDGITIICYQPRHVIASTVVAGSVMRGCDKCKAPVWVAPSSAHALADALAKKWEAGIICCCCAGLHKMNGLTGKLPGLNLPMHWHDFGKGDCECGMKREYWTKEIRDSL